METNKSYLFETHRFEILDKGDQSCGICFISPEGEAFKKERRKIYIVHDEIQVLYIGEADSSLKTRFRRACTSYNYLVKYKKARGGYSGYKWLNRQANEARQPHVCVAIFTLQYDPPERRKFIEAVEGELVYLVRSQLNYWPRFQHEIHFQNESGAMEIAESIFCQLQLKVI